MQTISGTADVADAGSTVSIYDNGGTTPVATAVVQPNGTWSTSVTLAQGANALVAKDTNAGGTGSSTSITDTLDTHTPGAPSGLSVSVSSGHTLLNGETNATLPTISGTGEAGDTITVLDGSTVLGHTTANSSGAWSFTPTTALGDGSHSFTAIGTDPAGTSSPASSALALKVDGGPTATTGSLTIDATQSTNVTSLISGLVTPGLAGDTETITGVTGHATLSNGVVTYTAPSTVGNDSFTYTVTDQLGDKVTSTVNVVVNPLPPTVAITSSGVLTNQALQTISGTADVADAGSTVSIYDNGGTTPVATAVVQPNGTWSTSVTLAQGANALVAKDTNAGGTGSSTSITDTLDTHTPGAPSNMHVVVGSSGAVVNGVTNITTPTISGSAEAGDTVVLTDGNTVLGSAVANASGIWSITPTAPLSYGSNTLTATATDPAGTASPAATMRLALDAGERVANGAVTEGHNQTTNLTNAIDSLVTPGLSGDTETITGVSGTGVSLVNGQVIYASGAAGTGSFSYTVTDQLGDTATGTVNTVVDGGPALATGSVTEGHNQTTNLTSVVDSLITPGLAGDTETITGVSGTGVSLVNGQVIYASGAAGTGSFSYTVTDQRGDVSTGTVNTVVDGGPALATGALTLTAGGNENITAFLKSLVTPGLSGDIETITAVSGNATLNPNGTVSYTAPSSGMSDSFTYTVRDQHGDTVTGTVNVAVAHASDVVNLSGSNAVVVGATSPVVASGVAGANVVGPAAGYATITGPVNNVTITAQGYDNTIIAGGGSDTINAGLDNAKVTVSDTNGNNTVTDALGTLSDDTTVTLGNGNDSVSLRGYGSTITLGDGNDTVSAGVGNDTITVGNGNDTVTTGGYHNVIHVGSGTDVINAGLGNDSVTIAGGPDTVIADGYSNTITSTGGDLTVSGDSGYSTITLGGDNNTLLLGGYNETVTLGLNSTGNNSVAGSLGSSVIITGAGNQSINASGYFNIITTGAGDSTINAGAGYETVNVGSGINSINASGNNNDITTNGGEDTVALSGWNNTINVHAGLTMVSGGYENTYNVDSVGNSGGLEIADFNAPYGDVLNLDAVLKPLAVGGVSLASLVTSTHAGNDMLISVITAGGSVQVADLQGLASSSLSGLIASHSVLL